MTTDARVERKIADADRTIAGARTSIAEADQTIADIRAALARYNAAIDRVEQTGRRLAAQQSTTDRMLAAYRAKWGDAKADRFMKSLGR